METYKIELSQTGQQAFRDAAAVPLSESDAEIFKDENDLMKNLATMFELCSYALHEIQLSIQKEAEENRKHGSFLLY